MDIYEYMQRPTLLSLIASMEKKQVSYLFKNFSRGFHVVFNEQNLHLKPILESLLYEKLVASI